MVSEKGVGELNFGDAPKDAFGSLWVIAFGASWVSVGRPFSSIWTKNQWKQTDGAIDAEGTMKNYEIYNQNVI